MTHRLTLTGALTAAALVLIATAEGAATHSTLTAAIATASSTDFRAELVARRSSGGSAPTATVTLTTFERNGSVWRKLTSKRLDGSFFWKTVSSPRAICRFELASAARPHVTVQLLLTPALGCGKPVTVQLPSR